MKIDKFDFKYEYYLYTWGGFYNDFNIAKHGFTNTGPLWFDTLEERTNYLNQLKEASEKYQAKVLCYNICEGFTTRESIICHRIVKIKETGKLIHSTWELDPSYSFYAANYIIKYKWTPGFNDEAAIDDENDLDKIEIVQEWITGSDIVINK